jgi:CHAT domain-containing protein
MSQAPRGRGIAGCHSRIVEYPLIRPFQLTDRKPAFVEVAGLDLERTEMVVLSACETELGSVAGGEGVLGLPRAFQIAGAKTTVASLWKVDDAATQILMKEFYTNLWQKKLGKLESLRQAQLRMLREYEPQQKKLVARGLDISAVQSTAPERGSPF